MGEVHDLGQKIKGKAQQLQGDLQQHTGQSLKGGVQKVKGKLNEMAADTKLRTRTRRKAL